jgi:hypothetical protein
MKNVSLVGTWLPIFGGFYNSRYQANEDDICDEYGNPLDYDKICNYINYNGYNEAVSKSVVKLIETKLIELGLVSSIRYEEIRSPKYYNFENDSINIEVGMSSYNINNLNMIIIENYDIISSEVKKRYSSRDGFMSSHSNDLAEWIEETLEFTENLSHKLGAILGIILEVVYEYDADELFNEYCDEMISLSDYFDWDAYEVESNEIKAEIISWVDSEYMSIDRDKVDEYVKEFGDYDLMDLDRMEAYEKFVERFGSVESVIYARIKEIESTTLSLF